MEQVKPERVVIINDRSSMVGGASNLACLLARQLEVAGIATTFFAGDTPEQSSPIADTLYLGDAPITEQPAMRAFTRGLYNRQAYRRLREIIKLHDGPNTVYHVHGWSKILSPSIFRALQSVRSRTVLHAHDYFLACPNGGFANYQTGSVCTLKPMSAQCLKTQCDKRGRHQKLWRTVRHSLREKLFPVRRKPANIICIHEGMKTYFDRAGISSAQVKTIRNPVDPFLPGGSSPWRQKNFFFIGRLEPEKGFEEAAAAAAKAGLPLHVIGDGAGRTLLESKYPDVVLHGWKSKDQMRPLLKTARAIAITSRVPEPFGLVAAEAITSGLPVIMTDGALLAAEIEKSGCGKSFPSGDVAALADLMQRLSQDDDLVRTMSENCAAAQDTLAQTTDGWVHAITGVYSEIVRAAQQPEVSQYLHTPAKHYDNTQKEVEPTSFSVGPVR